jgi:hypothetical protein
MAKARKRRKPETLSDQLRAIIDDGTMTRYRVCKLSQVDPSQLHRFMNHAGRLTTDSLDRVGLALKLRLVRDDE